MSGDACRVCGRPRGLEGDDNFASTLANLSGVQQPPEAAGLLSGAQPPDADLGTRSGPVEYGEHPVGYADQELCSDCRAHSGRRV